MKRRLLMLMKLVTGKAIIITPGIGNRADVVIGRDVTKSFAVNSLASTLKTIAL